MMANYFVSYCYMKDEMEGVSFGSSYLEIPELTIGNLNIAQEGLKRLKNLSNIVILSLIKMEE